MQCPGRFSIEQQTNKNKQTNKQTKKTLSSFPVCVLFNEYFSIFVINFTFEEHLDLFRPHPSICVCQLSVNIFISYYLKTIQKYKCMQIFMV